METPPVPALRPAARRRALLAAQLLSILFCVSFTAEAQSESRSIRLLLDYSQHGELLAGALARSAFEQEFQATVYSNRRLTADDLRPWDVVVAAFAGPLDNNAATAYRQFLSRGGGLVVLPNVMSSHHSATELRKIEPSASCAEGVYRSGTGYIRPFGSNFLAIGGSPTEAFTQFRRAVVEAGANRIGDR